MGAGNDSDEEDMDDEDLSDDDGSFASVDDLDGMRLFFVFTYIILKS